MAPSANNTASSSLPSGSQGRVPGLVSVIIGTYNIAGLIRETLDSVLAQTWQPLEVIVVDDGSSDDTWQVLQSYGDRIHAIRQANGGVAAARNTGLRHARGEFIALMDHDDLCMPDRIAIQMDCLQRFPQLGLCATEFSAFSDQGPIARIYSPHYYSQCDEALGGAAGHYPHHEPLGDGITLHWGNVYDDIACGNFVHPPTVLCRASVVDAIGEFDHAAGLMCDWDWLVRAARHTPFGFIDKPLLDYRRSATQISSERYRLNARLDTLAVAERIARRDPGLWQRRQAELKANLSEITMNAAYANAEAKPRLALQLLGRAIWRYRVFNRETLRVLAKALMPTAVVQRVRAMRAGARQASA